MGSQLDTYIHPNNPTNQEIKDQFVSEQQDSISQYGNDTYAGHLGIKGGLTIDKKIYDSYADAEEEMENNDKWGSAWALGYHDDKCKINLSADKIRLKLRGIQNDINEFKKNTIADIRNTKSKTIGCKKCGSSVSRKFVHNLDCVVCSHDNAYATTTYLKRLDAKKAKWTKVKQDLTDSASKAKIGKGISYLVGGYCPC